VNPELVSIARPDGPQQTFLKGLVAQHAELSGSARSAGLLDGWKEHAHKFWRIAPKAEVAKIEGSHEGSAEQAKA
jgi:glutamate synthase domain-containing protein 3